MSSRATRLVIVDQSLEGFEGHHFDYDLAVARAAKALGLDVSILANTRFSMADAFPVPVMGWFSKSSYGSHRSGVQRAAFSTISSLPSALRRPAISAAVSLRQKFASGKRSSGSVWPLPDFGARLVQGLEIKDLVESDHVLIHSLFNAELHSLAKALRETSVKAHLHIVLRRDAEESNVASDPWGGISVALSELTRELAVKDRIHFYSDTARLAEQYNEMLGGDDVRVLPIPNGIASAPPAEGVTSDEPLRLVYLGSARTEKGFHNLTGLVALLDTGFFQERRARLIAQSSVPVSFEETRVAKTLSRLSRYPSAHVELIRKQLPSKQYQALLHSADIVLLPYDAELYRRRSSGILVEALIAGKPVVVPSGSWLAEEAPAGTAVEFGDGRSFAEATAFAIANHARLAKSASASADCVRRRHSASKLVMMLTSAHDTPPVIESGEFPERSDP